MFTFLAHPQRHRGMMVHLQRQVFSSAATQPKKKTVSFVAKTEKYKPIVCVSEYGDLLNVKPLTKAKVADGKEDLRQVFMVDDNTDHKNLLKKLNHHPKAYFLFSPEGHYANAMAIYSALKRNLDQKYYGNDKRKPTRQFIDQ